MNTFSMEITPSQAREFLRLNITNRPVRNSWVKALSGIIKRGKWRITHQGIAITSDNKLLDGQHRLLAVIEADMPVTMMVSFDCDPATFDVIDGGVKRSISDHLKITRNEAAVATLIHRIALGQYFQSMHVAADQVSAVMAKCGEEISQVCHGGSKLSTSPIRAAIVVHMISGRPETFERFTLMRGLEFESLRPAERSFAKQVIDGTASARKGSWDLAGRAWRAFHPDHAHATKLQIKDISNPLAEMTDALTAKWARSVSQPASADASLAVGASWYKGEVSVKPTATLQ